MKTLRESVSPRLTNLIFLFLIFGAAFYRVMRVQWAPDSLPNFSPLMAIALCGALFLPLSRRMALLTPLVALALSDILLNIHYGVSLFSPYALVSLLCYAGAAGLGLGLRRFKASIPLTLTAVLASAVVFYLVTNTLSWVGNPAYAQTLAGWVQALTIGVPGFPPTWTFFRNALASNLVFALGFSVIALRLGRQSEDVALQAVV